MEQLSRSEEQVMAALWACSRAATRREIASHLPPECLSLIHISEPTRPY